MDAGSNLAESTDTTPTQGGTEYVAAQKKVIAVKEEAAAVEQPQVDIAPKPPVWQKSFGDLQVMNTQAGALVQSKTGLVFIPGCHVTDTNIFELDSPEAPVRRLGRPKGSKNKSAKVAKPTRAAATKRGGRPKGSKNKVKRGPGRPKGKRGPGRPKGSKNKK